MPVTKPDELTVAIEVELVSHVPPEGVPVSVVVPPIQMLLLPVIVALVETVNDFVTKLAPTVYVIVQVPADTPVTKPVELTVAIEGLLLLHVPPGVLSVRATDAPTQVPEGPMIGAIVIAPVTVKDIVRKQPPDNV